MKKCSSFYVGFLLIFGFISNANATAVTISDIPAYNWYHGCGPTAAASILGYYDLIGYDSLFKAGGWDEVRLTSNVQDEISSPAHNAKYDPDPDAAGPAPSDTSIADFFHTSENQPYGWSYLSFADDAFVDYANYQGYDDWSAWNEGYASGAFTWDDLIYEIDNDRPMMFLIDTDGNGGTDHFVPVFGYDDENNTYACYTTWSENETIRWASFQGMGNDWGVGYATFIRPGFSDLAQVPGPPTNLAVLSSDSAHVNEHTNAPVPEPSTMILLGTGLAAIVGLKRKKK